MMKVRIIRFAVRMLAKVFWWRKAAKNVTVLNRDIQVDGLDINVNIYTPQTPGPHPVIVYFHGGGFVVGDPSVVDGPCRDIAQAANYALVSVDYRLAPEAPFPAAAQDCIGAVAWVKEHGAAIGLDVDRIFVAGDSAGGNLAAVAALHYKETQPELIKGQVLIYPVTHHYSNETVSYREKAKGYGLTRDMMVWFWDTYYQNNTALEPGTLTHALSTPLAQEDLSGLPAALVMTAEHDPLRDEGIAYADKMAAAGVAVQHSLYADAQHGFLGALGPTTVHKKGIAEIAQWLRAAD